MDIWVVLAAAGAGYIAKHWQNPSRSSDTLSESPSLNSNLVKSTSPSGLHEKSCPFSRFARRRKVGEDSTEREQVAQGTSTSEVVSSFDGGGFGDLDSYGDLNVLSVSSSLPGFLGNLDLQRDGVENGVSRDMDESSSNLVNEASSEEMRTSYVSSRKRSLLRRRMQYVKPLSSLDSCLMAQLYNEHASIEEYVLSSVPSPSSPTVRPFFVTDGRKVISRTKSDTFSARENELQKRTLSSETDIVFGVPPLANIGSLELPRKSNIKIEKGQGGKLSRSCRTAYDKHFRPQAGSSEGALLFCLGISLGIISSFLANKQEVDKLNNLLKQTENLVQDLQEELEMKDSLTVKELTIEDFESEDTHENSYNERAPHAFFTQKKMDEPTKRFDGKEVHDQKAENQSESMSQIEAELEAELERLEINMNSTSLERRLSDLGELDPELRAHIVKRELRADMFGKRVAVQPYADRDGSGTSTTHSANYAVSPRELSLRLHEVIQSRLEQRIEELKTALQNSQKKVQSMELERRNPWRGFSNPKAGSSSINGSPTAEEQSPMSQPMVINLSGEALDAYNEVYDEFLKTNDSEEDLPSRFDKSSHQEDSYLFDGNLYLGQNGERSHFVPQHTIINGKEPMTLDDYISPGVGAASDDENGSDDEIEKLLIKHIVEKTKKGSTAVLNAQKVLFPLGEN